MRPTKVVVDLAKLDYNMQQLIHLVGGSAAVMAIVKANAYGHGAVEVARQALASGASWLGVAIPEEGEELRKAGIKAPILVLGGIDDSQARLVAEWDLVQTVFSEETLMALEREAKRLDKEVSVHLKIDTGMGRIGIRNIKEARKICEAISRLEHIKLQGAFTHFASSDEADNSFTQVQMRSFEKFIEGIQEFTQKSLKWVHAANSAAIIRYPDTYLNMVRAGISMYGYYPSKDVASTSIHLKPILEWRTRIVYIKEVEEGEGISYGRTFISPRKARIATLPVGYADGYNRLLSNKGWVLIHGQKAPVVGRVCMDQIMVDVTDISSPKVGDEAVLLGEEGGNRITADDLAELCGTISYEILTSISQRVPRYYVNGLVPEVCERKE